MCSGCSGDVENGPKYEPMSPDELAELSREAGRPLTELEAMEYLKRRVHRAAVESMLEGGDHD